MPSQFSAIGFTVSSAEDLAALASRIAERAETIDAKAGQYLKWAPPSGEQLWLQVRHNGDAMGMNPHFEGKSSVRIAVEARVARDAHTPLDGTFLAWANPPAGAVAGGGYPFAFDCPDAATHDALMLPAALTAQIAAFAQQITVYESQEAYDAAQAAQRLPFESRSFIPSGIISPSGEPVTPPESHALIAGQVIEAAERRNAVTGQPFWWALIDSPDAVSPQAETSHARSENVSFDNAIISCLSLPPMSKESVSPASGDARLPPDVVRLNDQIGEALMAAVMRGQAGEDDTQGFALSGDPALHAKQVELRAFTLGRIAGIDEKRLNELGQQGHRDEIIGAASAH